MYVGRRSDDKSHSLNVKMNRRQVKCYRVKDMLVGIKQKVFSLNGCKAGQENVLGQITSVHINGNKCLSRLILLNKTIL